MYVIIAWLSLGFQAEQSKSLDGASLVAAIEALQSPIQDFRCEFEGTNVANDKELIQELKLDGHGLIDTFSGSYLWKSGGDAVLSCYHRREPAKTITAVQMVVWGEKEEAELSTRNEDSKLGQAGIDSSVFTNTDRGGSFGAVFLIDTLKRLAKMEGVVTEVGDEAVDGRILKVLTYKLPGGMHPYQKFWIDLKRGGHAVRRETYSFGGHLMGRTDIKLASFPLGKETVWMPISATVEGHSSSKDGKPYFPAEPVSTEIIYINQGTLEFNKHPGAETFQLNHRPGTPVTDSLRKLTYEFGLQKPKPPLGKAAAEKALKEQIAQAEAQKTELVAATPETVQWWPWATGGMTFITLTSVVALWIQRQGR